MKKIVIETELEKMATYEALMLLRDSVLVYRSKKKENKEPLDDSANEFLELLDSLLEKFKEQDDEKGDEKSKMFTQDFIPKKNGAHDNLSVEVLARDHHGDYYILWYDFDEEVWGPDAPDRFHWIYPPVYLR